MTHMILWRVFSIGGDWVVNHIVTHLVCEVALFVGVVLLFRQPMEKANYVINFCDIHSV